MLHDHDNFQDALADYAYSRYRAGRGINGAIGKANELKQFFNRTGTSNTETPMTENLEVQE